MWKYQQFGGYWGSYAGDCALITTPAQQLVVDVGRIDTFKRLRQSIGRQELRTLFTHLHTDHVGDAANHWNHLRSSVQVYRPRHTTQLPIATDLETFFGSVIIPLEATGELLTEDLGGGAAWSVKGIVPTPTDEPKDENQFSLGEILTLQSEDALVYAILSLGDMTPDLASQPVVDALRETIGDAKLGVVKLAHHGSGNNIFEAIWPWIDRNTVVASSGYSGTETRQLIAFTRAARPKGLLFLFDTDLEGNIRAFLAGEGIRSFQRDLPGIDVRAVQDLTVEWDGVSPPSREIHGQWWP